MTRGQANVSVRDDLRCFVWISCFSFEDKRAEQSPTHGAREFVEFERRARVQIGQPSDAVRDLTRRPDADEAHARRIARLGLSPDGQRPVGAPRE